MTTRSMGRRLIAGAAVLLLVAGTAEGAQRTFVSTAGSDASASCSLGAPCRGFAKAITLTDPSGEIVVLDSGGYGSVTIGKSVTITSPAGVYAGISVFAGQDGIVVGPGSGKVVLRGLTINGQGGNYGIRVLAGDAHVENVVVSGMGNAGVLVEGGSAVRLSGVTIRLNAQGLQIAPQTSAMAVTVRDSEISGNSAIGVTLGTALSGFPVQLTMERTTVTRNNTGLLVSSMPTSPAILVLTQSVVSENAGAGVQVASGGTVYVRDTAVTRNATGLSQQSTGVLNACGSNLLVANGVAQSGTINVNAAACLDQVAGGTVVNVATGPGLTGGPITTTGTIGLAPTQLLPTTACAGGQVAQWSGSAWTCASAGGTGTVTNVGTGTGLTGGPITTTGTIGLAPTQLLPTTACAANQVPQWSGSAWTCAAAGGTGTVTNVGTGTGLTGGPITTTGTLAADTTYLQRRVSSSCAAGSSIRAIAADGTVTCQVDTAGPANAYVQGGNAFGANGIVGTTDNFALDVRVNNARVMRYEPNAISPNVIGGSPANNAAAGVRGATIAGGGVPSGDTDPDYTNEGPNRVIGHYGTIGGGYANLAGGSFRDFATIGGGSENTAGGSWSTIGGGWQNVIDADGATVAGGSRNSAIKGVYATVGGGFHNTASFVGATVAGGEENVASESGSTVAGGFYNSASNFGSFVGGGEKNAATGWDSAVAGGRENAASGWSSGVGAGQANQASGKGSYIGGGGWNGTVASGNSAAATAATIGGGYANAIVADGAYGAIGGGQNNRIDAPSGTNLAIATIGGGYNNVVSLGGATIAGGNSNQAAGFDAAVGGGNGNIASGAAATVPGGNSNAAQGNFSFAAGRRAKALADGVFAFADSTDADFTAGTPNSFVGRFTGGYGLWTNSTSTMGCSLAPGGGSWSCVSSRDEKRDFAAVDAQSMLQRVVALPITEWRYKTEVSGARHLGPMAQDFHAAFALGDSDRTIGVLDAAGVALAAIQGLNAKLEATVAAQAREIAELRDRLAQVESLRGEMAAMKRALAAVAGSRMAIANAAP